MACSEGLASNIEQALDMVPIQMLRCIEGYQRVQQRGEGQQGKQVPMSQRPQGTPQDFAAMLMAATQGQVAVS